jgi:hypothetical protein
MGGGENIALFGAMSRQTCSAQRRLLDRHGPQTFATQNPMGRKLKQMSEWKCECSK